MLFVLGLVFPYQAKRLAWGNISKMTYFMLNGMQKNTTPTISHLNHARNCQVNVLECEQCQLVSCSPTDLPQQRK